MPNIFITGANRGIGLELARLYAERGWRVIATAREPETATELAALNVEMRPLDVADRNAIQDLAATLKDPFDVLIANAGVFGPASAAGGQSLGSLDYGAWAEVMAVNLFGAVATAEAFRGHVSRSSQKKLVAITSQMGSIADASGGFYAYRTSKAALNMAYQALAHDLAGRGVAVGVIHPGWVRTRMGGPHATVSERASAEGIAAGIDGLVPSRGAVFQNYRGEPLPW